MRRTLILLMLFAAVPLFADGPAGPDLRFFEPVLIPIVFNGHGALGSEWRTDFVIRSATDALVPTYRPIHSRGIFGGITAPDLIGERPRGYVMYVHRDFVNALSYGINVREVSRNGDDVPTRVPVVRERDFTIHETSLLNVPTSPRFRLQLRVYGLTGPIPLRVTLYTASGWKSEGTLAAQPPQADDEPYFGSLDLTRLLIGTSARPANEAVHALITPVSHDNIIPYWAWITVTDNDTQRVTFVAPQ